MAKFHPQVLDDTGPRKQRNKRIVQDIVGKITGDQDHRRQWLDRQRDYYLRRYSRKFRGTNRPWQGASDIVMPTMDMTIDRLKATFVRSVLTRPVVQVEAKTPAFGDQARLDQEFLNWLLDTSIPDFKEQVMIGMDTVLQYGFCVFKIFWDYRTRKTRRVLNVGDLPRRYADVLPGLVDSAANQKVKTNLQDLLQGEGGLELRVAEEAVEGLRGRIAIDFDLDDEDPIDSRAIGAIVAGIKGFVSGKGDPKIVYTTREVEADNPRIVCIDPEDIIVPNVTRDLQSSNRITQRLLLTESSFKQRARDHKWSKSAIKAVLDSAKEKGPRSSLSGTRGSVQELEGDRDAREGIVSTSSDELIEVWEVHWMMDIDGDGMDERVTAPIHPGTNTLLRAIREEPYEHGLYPFVQITFERNDQRFYSSRGVPEKIDDIDIEITKRHRAKLNNLDMRVPCFTYRFGSEINPADIQFRPGEMIPTINPDDIAPIPIPSFANDNEREENILLTWNERYIGAMDQLASQSNISEARTATEIRALQSSGAQAISHRVEVVQGGMKKVYGQIWDLWNQWGDETVYTRVTGGQFRRKTRVEIQRDYNIVPIGTVLTTDPEIEKQRAQERFSILLQLWTETGGIINGTHQIDIVRALKFWLDRENRLESTETLRQLSPEELQAIQEQAAARQQRREAAEDNVPLSSKDLLETVKEIKQGAPHGSRQRISK